MSTGASLYLLSAAATCALLIGVCLAVIVVVQYQHAQDGDSLSDEPAVSLEEMMSRAVKPKQLVRAATCPSPFARLCSALRARHPPSAALVSHSGPRPAPPPVRPRPPVGAQIKQSSTLYRRQDSLLDESPAGASDAPAAAVEEGVASGAGADGELGVGSGGSEHAEAHILAAYEKDAADDAAESDVCWICEGGPREAVFLECGHGGVCYPCAEKCWSTQRRHGCPMCRQPVTQVVRVAADAKATKDGQLVVEVIS